LYQQAAQAGQTDAMSNVGWMYEKGEGVNKDYQKTENNNKKEEFKNLILSGISYMPVKYCYPSYWKNPIISSKVLSFGALPTK